MADDVYNVIKNQPNIHKKYNITYDDVYNQVYHTYVMGTYGADEFKDYVVHNLMNISYSCDENKPCDK